MYIYTKELRMSDFSQTDLIEALLKDFFRAGYWTIKTHFNECVYNMKIEILQEIFTFFHFVVICHIFSECRKCCKGVKIAFGGGWIIDNYATVLRVY